MENVDSREDRGEGGVMDSREDRGEGGVMDSREDRGEGGVMEPSEPLEPLEPSEPSDYESTRDIPVSSDISYNVQASSDISSVLQASSDIASEIQEKYYQSEIQEKYYQSEVQKRDMKADMERNAKIDTYMAHMMAEIKALMERNMAKIKAHMERNEKDAKLKAEWAKLKAEWERNMAEIKAHMERNEKDAKLKAEWDTYMAKLKAEWYQSYQSYQSGTKSPVEETARSLTDALAKSEILDIIQQLKQEIPAIQATRACLNPKNTKFDITVVSKRPNEVKRRTKDIITERISRNLDYDLEVREITEEGITVTNSEEFIEFFSEKGYSKEILKLQRVISKHSNSFMKNDPNITCISFSPVKSTGYGTAEHKIVKEPCIVFFVQVKFDKKRIPLDSKRIPEIIEGIKTDVREGIVETLMQAQQDALSIGLGCSISSVHRSGTLGPIVSTEQNTSGFLTSLHVLFSQRDLKAISKNNHTDDEAGLNTPVYKETKDRYIEIGKVIKVYFANGNEDQSKPGYEVGLVELHPNVHIEEGNSQANGLAHLTGETTVVTEDNCENRFKKLGAETGLTNAIYKGLTSTYFQYEGINLYYLCCQIELLSIQYNKEKGKYVVEDFAQPGDSGAMVTIKEDITHKIVGIFTGKRSDNVYLITPIQPICDRLQEDGWKICGQRNQNNNGEQMDTS